jgi:hypothetical protein
VRGPPVTGKRGVFNTPYMLREADLGSADDMTQEEKAMAVRKAGSLFVRLPGAQRLTAGLVVGPAFRVCGVHLYRGRAQRNTHGPEAD